MYPGHQGRPFISVIKIEERELFEEAIKETGANAIIGPPNKWHSDTTHFGLYGNGDLSALWKAVHAKRNNRTRDDNEDYIPSGPRM